MEKNPDMNKYLTLDIEKLFREHNVNEIILIQKEIQYEIDKKSQQLKTTVGEHYRNVITASDTIKCMQQTITNVVNEIEDIIDVCNSLKDLRLSSFENTKKAQDLEKEKLKKDERTLSIQIKILIYLPEQIWEALDEKNFLLAAQLYLFARHIYTGFSLDTVKNVLQSHPVIQMQWTKLEHFQQRILNQIEVELQNNDINAEIASEYLAAFVLLHNTVINDLLNKFIEYRKLALRNVLFNSTLSYNTVRAQTCIALKSIINTIQLLYECFIDNGDGEGFIFVKLKNIVGEAAKPTFASLKLLPDPLVPCLPTVVSEYKPILIKPMEPINCIEMGHFVTDWLDWTKESIETETKKQLALVTSIKSLDNIREEALKIEITGYWDSLSKRLSLPKNFNVWFMIFQPLITARVKELMDTKWKLIVQNTDSDISEVLVKASSGITACPELDLRWFIWMDEKNDVLTKVSLEGENKFVAKGLLMQSKGFSPNVVKLCENFDAQLTSLLSDLEMYLYGNDNSVKAIVRAEVILNKMRKGNGTFDQISDKTEIQNYLQSISREHLNKLIQIVIAKSSDDKLSTNEKLSYYLMTARFLLALPQLSPQLVKCFKTENKSNSWNELNAYFLAERTALWTKWSDVMVTRLTKIIESTLTVDSSMNSILEHFPQWNVIDIEEQSEEATIKSQIRVPSQPNFALQNLLLQISTKLNSVIRHTLPIGIHTELIEKLIKKILDIYEKNSKDEDLLQTHALQYLLDVKYVGVMFIQRENIELNNQAQEICDILQKKIDPFDFNVFYSYIQRNITTSARKTQNIYGILIANPEQVASMLDARQTTAAVILNPEKNSMVLTIPENPNSRFPLLPVTAPVTARTRTPNPQNRAPEKRQVKTVAKNPKKNVEPASGNSSRSGAASFLTDWFGS